ncbi:MAG TPA: hypothetical protein VK572_13155 [Burkholderiales bacterium]|nr:hypothetical protein [Burkholderiales bacterium]
MRLGSIANWALRRKHPGTGRSMEKKCQGCRTAKPLSEFYEVRGGRNRGIYRVRERDRSYPLGKCKACRILQVRERQLLIKHHSEIA